MRTFLCIILALGAEASILKENTRISPSLQPESSKKFFNKDNPVDKAPKVDVLHFKHPYPVVQDSGEFDDDFVKDENTDNGEWAAQSEYDRLRHKLRQLKKQAAEALAKKEEEKSELDKAMAEYQEDMAKEKADIEQKKSEIIEPIHPDKPTEPNAPNKPSKPDYVADKVVQPKPEPQEKPEAAPKKEEAKGWSWSWPSWSWPWSTPKAPDAPNAPDAPDAPDAPGMPGMPKVPGFPKPTQEPVDTSDAAKGVEQAIKDFKECQRQLAEAKEELKKLMEELEQAKMKQVEAHERVNQAIRRQLEAEKNEEELHQAYLEEKAEHAAAEEAYLKQKAKVDKLHAQLDAAAAKVKAIRDAEDANGGVYPTPEQHSAASTMSTSLLILAVVAGRQWA